MEEEKPRQSVEKKPFSFSFLLWRVCNVLMGLFFLVAAYVQINDPDAGLWIVAYIIPAALCILISITPQITENLIWKSLSELHVLVSTLVAGWLGHFLLTRATRAIIHEEEGRWV
uniref:Transmembrane protein 220 n=1 Tax=Latimeria chalumnae TaxID=7897 RepID=M3XKH9_LATCH